MSKTDLNVAAPEGVAAALRAAADEFRQSTADLQADWGDPDAGLVWSKLADVLERAATACDKAVKKHFR